MTRSYLIITFLSSYSIKRMTEQFYNKANTGYVSRVSLEPKYRHSNLPPSETLQHSVLDGSFKNIMFEHLARGVFIQGVFKKRPNFCYKDFIAHFTEF